MKYQLVLQFPASSIKDYDAMIDIEDLLSERLSEKSQIDGHDAGSSEMNIFIISDDPISTFTEVRNILNGHSFWPVVRAAYRENGSDQYKPLWPKNLTDFKVA